MVLIRSFSPNSVLVSFGSIVTFALYSFVIFPPVTAAASVPLPLSVTFTVTVTGLPSVVQPSPAASSVIVYVYVPAFVYVISSNGITFVPVLPAS